MANTTIPNLPAVISLNGTELIEVVQSGTSSRANLSQVVALANNPGTLSPLPPPVQGTDTVTVSRGGSLFSLMMSGLVQYLLSLANSWANQQAVTPYRANISGAVSIDLALAKSNNLHLTLTGNVSAFSLTNPLDGAVYNIRFIENSTGGWTMPSLTGGVFKWSNGTAPSFTTTANAVNFASMEYGATEGTFMCAFLPNMS